MFGRALTMTMSVLLAGFIIMLVVSYDDHKDIQTVVNQKTTNTVESISTLGIMTDNMYEDLEMYVNILSLGKGDNRYFIQLKLEKQISPNVYDVFYESSEDRKNNTVRKGQVVGRPLDVGDKITVYVEDRSTTMFGRIMNIPLFNLTFSNTEKFIRSSKTSIVDKRYPDTVKGYDVIADLNTNPFNYINEIVVITKVNEVGQRYTTPTSLPTYKTYNISDPSNINYIFPNGEFMRDEDVIGGRRIVHYIQRY